MSIPGSPSRVLLVTGEPVSENLAGPAIRCWQMAVALAAAGHTVTLASTGGVSKRSEAFSTAVFSGKTAVELVDNSDVLIFQGSFYATMPWLARKPQVQIMDLYDPFQLEFLYTKHGLDETTAQRRLDELTSELNAQLGRADLVLCASERQRDLWLGYLGALGRLRADTSGRADGSSRAAVNGEADASSQGDTLVRIVPFGTPDEPFLADHVASSAEAPTPGVPRAQPSAAGVGSGVEGGAGVEPEGAGSEVEGGAGAGVEPEGAGSEVEWAAESGIEPEVEWAAESGVEPGGAGFGVAGPTVGGSSWDVPPGRAPVLRTPARGIGPDDVVLLWAGGLYDWFDPQTLIRAVALARERAPALKLFFLASTHPNLGVEPHGQAAAARSLAAELGVLDTHVFFNDGWVSYSDRVGFLAEADIGVTTHPDSLETHFSFRTRNLDYLWSGLPLITTDGDVFAELVAATGAGVVVPAGDVEALAAVLVDAAEHADRRQLWSQASAELGELWRWSRVLRPLLDFMLAPQRSVVPVWGVPDADVSGGGGLVADVRMAFRHLRAGGFSLLWRRVRARRERSALRRPRS